MKNGGFTKVENSAIQKFFPETRLIYNVNNNPYNLEIIYPASWNMGSSTLTGDLTVVKCSKEESPIYTTCAVLCELNIDGEMSEQPLELLENKIREYVDSKGSSIYTISNANIEQLTLDDGSVVDILKFEYNEGKYYKTHCYCKIEIVDSTMYVATVGIIDKELNDEILETKDSILKSFKIVE